MRSRTIVISLLSVALLAAGGCAHRKKAATVPEAAPPPDQGREQLARNAQFLKQYPQFLVTLEGHCDDRGTPEYNLALGERRAFTARDYLASLGLAQGRLRTMSYGEERPVCTDAAESCWSQNRRAHPVVTGRSNN